MFQRPCAHPSPMTAAAVLRCVRQSPSSLDGELKYARPKPTDVGSSASIRPRCRAPPFRRGFERKQVQSRQGVVRMEIMPDLLREEDTVVHPAKLGTKEPGRVFSSKCLPENGRWVWGTSTLFGCFQQVSASPFSDRCGDLPVY